MKLLITDAMNVESTFDTVVMNSTEFNLINCHPYIASSNFDCVIIDITNSSVKLFLVQKLMGITMVVPKITQYLTSYSISVLSELYKDEAAKLRYSFMRDKDGLSQVINELSSKFNWDRFY